MSGFEVVGVVLGTLPLVVSALENYANGVRTIRRLLQYKWEIKTLSTILEAEEVRFRNTCEVLIDGIDRAGEMEQLLKNPGGPLWKQGMLGERLETRLSTSYNVFFKCIQDMNDALEMFKNRLGLDASGKVQWTDKASLKKAWKAGRLVLTMDDYKDLVTRIKENNRTLKELTNQSIRLEPSRQGRSRAKRFNELRKYALDIYNAVGSAFRCKCKDQHQAGFSLLRDSGEKSQSLDYKGGHPFKILISGVPLQHTHDIHWQQLQLELVPIAQNEPQISPNLPKPNSESTKPKARRVGFADDTLAGSSVAPFRTPQSSTKHLALKSLSFASVSVASDQDLASSKDSAITEQILDLCEKLRTQTNPFLSTSLGVISDKYTNFRVHCPAQPVASLPRRSVSLSQILNGKASSCSPIPFMEKLHMAAIVSSAVLELYRTPWMQSEPSKDGIFFFEGSRRLHTSAFIATQIKQIAPDPDQEEDETLPPYIENKALFSLGVLLIELLFGIAIETLRTEKDPTSTSDIPDWALRYSIATRLLKDESILLEGGSSYESAVRSCIKCNFDRFREMDLDNDEFRQAVYERVVVVLEDIPRGFGRAR